MKKQLFFVLTLGVVMFSCRQKELLQQPGQEIPSAISGGSVSTNTPTYLTYDQSFIDLVYYSLRNIAAGKYIQSAAGRGAADYVYNLSNCTTGDCVSQVSANYGVSLDILDDYVYSAMAAGVLLRYYHPELEKLSDYDRNKLFSQSLRAGMNSTDTRWLKIKQEITPLLPSFSDEIYKPSTDWTAYVDCFIDEIGGVFVGVLKIGAVVEAIRRGQVTKAVSALKGFLKTTLGRTISYIGLAIMAWDIFSCCYDVYNDGGSTVFVPSPLERYAIPEKSYINVSKLII